MIEFISLLFKSNNILYCISKKYDTSTVRFEEINYFFSKEVRFTYNTR